MKINGESYKPNGPYSVTIEVETKEEMDHLKAAVCGDCWVRSDDDGNAIRHPRHRKIEIEPDPIIEPHFAPSPPQTSFLPYDETPDDIPYSPSVYVEHLCGYSYTAKNYTRAVAWMESAGFECMRSRRSGDGRYWETWYLPGLYRARGPLQGIEDVESLARKVCDAVQPGRVIIGGKSWSLGFS